MKILHLDPDDLDNPLSGGGPVRTFEIYRRLARRHDVTVLTPTFPGSEPECVRDGVRYVRLGRRIGDHGSSHHLTFLAALPAAVRRFEYDLLVEDTMPPCSTTWTPFFARRSAPLVASVQWWMAEIYTERLKLPFHWGQSVGLRLYRHFIALTEQMRGTILAGQPRARIEVIPNGVDADLFHQPIVRDDEGLGRGILYIGRIDYHNKGLDLLLEALARLPAGRRPHLTMAGHGNATESALLDAQIERLGLRDGITLLGKVDAATRARLLRECRFTVMPSRLDTFGMTIAEANAAGRIALVFDKWPMNEVSAPRVERVPAFDVAAYAAAIDRLTAMPDLVLIRLGEHCRNWARRYDWDVVASAQESFYLDAMYWHRRGETRGRAA